MTDSDEPIRDVRLLLGEDSRELACGVDIDELLDQAADGRATELTPHQQQCPHCRAALAEFGRLWEPVRQLAAQPVRVPAAIKTAVAAQIRRLVADTWYTLQLTDGGLIQVATRVVATIARDAARTVPGVRVAFGRTTHGRFAAIVEKATLGHLHPHSSVGVLGRTAVVDLALAVRYGDRVDEVAREVQQRVIRELRDTVGLRDITVNVTVDDVA